MRWRAVRLTLAASLAVSCAFGGRSGQVHWICDVREVTFFWWVFWIFCCHPSLAWCFGVGHYL